MKQGVQRPGDVWSAGDIRLVPLEEIGEHYGRYRIHTGHAVGAMENSLKRYGQISPVVICFRDGALELVDGFKRLWAARTIDRMPSLTARYLELEDRAAKAAIYSLNRIGKHIHELEEAYLVYALVREDGLSQIEAAELLGRHKSWVCRRLALLERLCPEAKEDLKLGLLSPTAARQLTRLPAGNQADMLSAMQRESLSGTELCDVIDAYLGCADKAQRAFVLDRPREAISQARSDAVTASDPRLSGAGNKFSKELGILLDRLSRMETWFHIRGLAELSRADRRIVAPHVERLVRQGRVTSDLAQEFYMEITRYERGTA
jgi:hypothetical protein